MAINKILSEISSIPERSIMPNILLDIEAQIAEMAYYKAESRGFTPGHELEDWLEAERELLDILR